jgi:GWxTD domain-containing protein
MIQPFTSHIRIVLWQSIFLLAIACMVASSLRAQRPDSVRVDSGHVAVDSNRIGTDSIHKVAFAPAPSVDIFATAPKRQRTLDAVVTGGAGFYSHDAITPFQGTGNLEFYAQTSILDLTAGVHLGFSDPITRSLSIGLRFPLTESDLHGSALFADAELLFFDKADTEGLQTGLRAAFGGRYGPANIEYRLATEIRRLPFSGEPFEAWGGIELGFFLNLSKEEVTEPSRKDSLRAELRYIATSEELDALEGLQTNEQIDQWFDRFWRARNITHSTQNDAEQEYMRRVALANERYGSPRRMGVTTDMGRVLLIYGEPDQIESAASLYDPQRRYMLWTFSDRVKGYRMTMMLFVTNIGSSSTGIFANHGEYRQIYSNIPGEPSEGIPSDLPPAMQNYIESFGR